MRKRGPNPNRGDVARIATFNIKIFGETKMGKTDVVSELVNITLRYDMVVVQEIKDMDQTVPYDFLDAINAETNETYAMVLSERSGQQEDDEGGQEQYAFYYRTSRFTFEESWLHNDSELDEFQREPFIASFNLLSKNGTNIENITLITVHTKPAQAVNETVSPQCCRDLQNKFYRIGHHFAGRFQCRLRLCFDVRFEST